MKYQIETEHEKIAEYLRTLSLSSIGVNIPTSEIVVLMDSGYDCKEIQNVISSHPET